MVTIPPAKHPSERRKVRPAVIDANANVVDIFLLATGALVIVFDRDVIVDPVNPPTTWSFNGITSIQSGAINLGNCVYLILNGIVNNGDPVTFAANDPGARTIDGGYVNGVTTAVSNL